MRSFRQSKRNSIGGGGGCREFWNFGRQGGLKINVNALKVEYGYFLKSANSIDLYN